MMRLTRVPAFVLACSLILPSRAAAQFLDQDTAAVRVILSENQLDLPISEVVEIVDGRVVSLILEDRRLARVPSHIGALSALRTLSLAGNLLDSLPTETWNLANLSLLDLSGNSLDTLPEAVAQLPFLRYLDLSGNRLKSLPGVVGGLDLLDSLDLRMNRLESLPDEIRSLRPETVVRLGGNQLCALSQDLADWANQADPEWRSAQSCGSPVRRTGLREFRERVRRERAAGGWVIRIDRAGLPGSPIRIDLAGRSSRGRGFPP